MSKISGLPVSVYRNAEYGDSTNGGVSSLYSRFILVDPDNPLGPFEADNEKPGSMALTIVPGPFGSLRAVMANDETGEPLDGPEGEIGPMFGGNFIYTSDSRGPNLPVKIFDRYESKELYDRLSL